MSENIVRYKPGEMPKITLEQLERLKKLDDL